jgi:glycerol-1-phosphate dehydrogenase [NAD(P)+]
MRELTDLAAYFDSTPSQLADTVLHCPVCGRDHKIPFQVVKSGRHVVDLIPNVIESILGQKADNVSVVYDRQIEGIVTPLVLEPLKALGIKFTEIPLGKPGALLSPSVLVGNKAAESLSSEISLLIGVGSGVISDLTKWIATKRSLPFMLVGSAASMNAYTSITATMTEDNVKTSRWLDPAYAVLLDADLLATAPQEMTCAGVGDLLARNTANADWKLSELIRGTYFCPIPFQMMTPYQDRFLANVHSLGENDPEGVALLGDAVLVSGYSMTVLDGETSPSSGSEHILSHFFDFQHDIFDLPKNLHGAQVGVGTIIMSAAFEILREMKSLDFNLDNIERRRLSQTAVNLDHRRVFGDHGKIFDLVVAEKRIREVDYRKYIGGIINAWEEIWSEIDPYLMPTKSLRQALEESGGATKLSDINRSAEDAVQALLYGSHYRPRYTILDLYWELGLFPVLAQEILERAGVLD